VARFAELGVAADASPALWFPNPMSGVIAQQVQDHYMERIWPWRDLRDAGTLVAAGSARAAGLAQQTGRLSPGLSADFPG
jgi:predicted amidohydrolase YtcJ